MSDMETGKSRRQGVSLGRLDSRVRTQWGVRSHRGLCSRVREIGVCERLRNRPSVRTVIEDAAQDADARTGFVDGDHLSFVSGRFPLGPGFVAAPI